MSEDSEGKQVGTSSLGLSGDPLEEFDFRELSPDDSHSSSLKRGGKARCDGGTVPRNSTESSSIGDRDMTEKSTAGSLADSDLVRLCQDGRGLRGQR